MSEIRITHTDNTTDESIIEQILEVESAAYPSEICGSARSVLPRFRQFKDMAILAYDGDKAVGNLGFFPIAQTVYEDILYSGIYRDDNITPCEMEVLSDHTHLFIISVAVRGDYQHQGIGHMLMEGLFERVRAYEAQGYHVRDILAIAISEGGERVLAAHGFTDTGIRTRQKYKVYLWKEQQR